MKLPKMAQVGHVGLALEAARKRLAALDGELAAAHGRDIAMVRTKLDEAEMWLGRIANAIVEGRAPE